MGWNQLFVWKKFFIFCNSLNILAETSSKLSKATVSLIDPISTKKGGGGGGGGRNPPLSGFSSITQKRGKIFSSNLVTFFIGNWEFKNDSFEKNMFLVSDFRKGISNY